MRLPADFSFSQQNLQDYIECARRFELRYVQKLAWPAIRSEPVLELERQMCLGERFHQMVQQHQLGLPEETVVSQASEPELEEWWRSYLGHPLEQLPEKRYPEITLAASFQGTRLIAKYDLIAIDPGQRAVIVDWKTNRRPAPLSILKVRAQTRLYPFLLSLAGAHLNAGTVIQPEIIQMIYWFTADPARPAVIPYSQQQFEIDREYIARTIAQITAQEAPFPLTEDERECLFCNYRSLCQRGAAAGRDSEEETAGAENASALDIDFDQIAEIEF